jgi:hypothetical protein
MIYPRYNQLKLRNVWFSPCFFSQACGEEEVEAVEMAEVHRGQGLMVKDIEKQ